MDDATMKLGLLLESADANQNLARTGIERLNEHVRDLDGLVRSEIRSTLLDELHEIHVEISKAAQALRNLRRSIAFRLGAACLVALTVTIGIPAALTWHFVPSAAELSALRAERDALSSNIARLQEQGGRLEWRHCGERSRLCVRVEPGEPAFGGHSDFRIVKGH